MLASALRASGWDVVVRLGFGTSGFLSDAKVDSRFLSANVPSTRKLLYPLWLVVENIRTFGLLRGKHRLWANSIHTLPAVLPMLLFAPRRLIVHVHELRFSGLFMALLRFAVARGATLVTVSAHHARQLGLPAHVLWNAVGEMVPAPAPGAGLIFLGNANALKGFPLFLAVAGRLRDLPLEPRAFVAGGLNHPDETTLAAAQAAGVAVVIGETRPERHWAGAWLALQLTDPALWEETFSLVTAEALWHLVPVGGAGTAVLPEVAGDALAFNIASRDADEIAAAIRALWADPARHAALVEAAARIRPNFAFERFADEAAAIAEAAHG